jgi:general secretion pathway protein G
VEVLLVVVIIAILAALLFPAISGAMRTARNAAVAADINALAASLESFKSKYGDYPPSRIILAENGFWDTSSPTATATYLNATNGADVTYAALAQRSVAYLRKFWPRVQVGTTAPLFTGTGPFYDFDGDGVMATAPVVLEGHECLVFFLGGIPQQVGTTGDPSWAAGGWGKRPDNPFTTPRLDTNRTVPMHEFKNARLSDTDDGDGFPAYLDGLATARPLAYFSAYGHGGYDPNDCNLTPAEPDDAGAAPGVRRLFRVGMAVRSVAGVAGDGNGGDSPPRRAYAGGSGITFVTSRRARWSDRPGHHFGIGSGQCSASTRTLSGM